MASSPTASSPCGTGASESLWINPSLGIFKLFVWIVAVSADEAES